MIAARQIFLGRGGAKLPYDAEVEYLESTGTQYIDTLHIPSIGTRLEAIASAPVLKNNNGFGCYYTTNRFQISQSAGAGLTNGFSVAIGQNPIFYTGNYDSNVHTFVLDNGGGVSGGLASASGLYEHNFSAVESVTDGFSIALFARHTSTGYKPGKWRMNAVSIYEFGTMVLDFIPVRIGTEGAMYDRVSGQLFRNQGAGAFTYGNDK